MKKHLATTHAIALTAGAIAYFSCGLTTTMAQQPQAPADQAAKPSDAQPGITTQGSEYVTINVKDANISEVLKAYSLQTGQSIVVGPDVVSENVNVRLNNIPWQEALDVILKPYGFGYRVVGDTIVISKLENIVTVEGIEPLSSKVFTLKYLDAYDIKEVCEAQLSSRGKFTIMSNKGLPGWEFGNASANSSKGAATEGGIRSRKKQGEIQKSKTVVITDVPASLTAIADIIEEMDQPPAQVLIESRFLEINSGGLTEIGLNYINGLENIQERSLSTSSSGSTLQPTPISDLNRVLNMTTGFPDPLQTGAAGALAQGSGLRLSSAQIGDAGFDLLFNLLANDNNANILSSPKVLTLNNQEAAILVGQKYPIIQSQSNTGGGSSSTTSTSLDYYENIGIQLNVIPQVCDGSYVNMIVHPAVSQIADYASGVVSTGGGSAATTSYPVLDIREAETQVMIKSGNTAVIGGLETDRDTKVVQKIPLLGDIPFIGRLFRNERSQKEKVDLLIFIKATIVDADAYAEDSAAQQKAKETAMNLIQEMPVEDDVPAATVETEPEEAGEAKTSTNSPAVQNEDILNLVHSMDAPTNTADQAEM